MCIRKYIPRFHENCFHIKWKCKRNVTCPICKDNFQVVRICAMALISPCTELTSKFGVL